MMRARALLLGAACLPWAVAQAQGFAVAGRVLDAVTHSPVAGATLTLVPADTPGGDAGLQRSPGPAAMLSATTGPDGGFRFTVADAGRYQLTAARRGYRTESLDQHGSSFAAVVTGPREKSDAIEFLLEPNATIEGSVRDSSGDPVENGMVSLFQQAEDGSGAVRRVGTAAVDEDGSYLFGDLEPGSYSVAVSAQPWFAQSNEERGGPASPLDVAYPTTFYPAAESSSGAEAIRLAPGDDAHADMTLQATPAVHLRLEGASWLRGGSLPHLSEEAFGAAMPLSLEGVSFHFDGGVPTSIVSLAPGTYTLAEGDSRRTISATEDATIEASDHAPAPVPLTGQLARSDRKALPPGCALTLTPARSAGLARGAFARGFRGRRGLSPALFTRPTSAPAGPGGRFAISIAPGDYTVGVEPTTLVITGTAVSGAALNGMRLHVESGPAMLAATVAAADAEIHGKAVDARGLPEAGALVLLIPADASAFSLYREDESNTDGSWEMRQIPAGRYRVLAIRDGWDLAWREPRVQAEYLGGAVSITVREGAPLAVERPVAVQRRQEKGWRSPE